MRERKRERRSCNIVDFVQAWTQQKMTKLEEAIKTGSKSDEFRISRTATTTATTTTATTAGVTGIRYVARFIMYPQWDKPAWGLFIVIVS